jgi:hypothetical protein
VKQKSLSIILLIRAKMDEQRSSIVFLLYLSKSLSGNRDKTDVVFRRGKMIAT